VSPTEMQLIATLRSPVVRLDAICDTYLNMQITRANDMASMHALGVPTFFLSDSRKAPRMVKVSDLAELIDTQAAQARAEWENSQV
jgi:hypothetical protein